MALNKKKMEHGDVLVSTEEDGVDAKSEAPTGAKSTKTFKLYKAVANIFLFVEGTVYKEKKNQKDKFDKKVVFEIPIPDEVLKHPDVKEKGKDILKIAYFDKGLDDWVPFKNQTLDKKANLGTVEFKEWIKDPHVGLGST